MYRSIVCQTKVPYTSYGEFCIPFIDRAAESSCGDTLLSPPPDDSSHRALFLWESLRVNENSDLKVNLYE